MSPEERAALIAKKSVSTGDGIGYEQEVFLFALEQIQEAANEENERCAKIVEDFAESNQGADRSTCSNLGYLIRES